MKLKLRQLIFPAALGLLLSSCELLLVDDYGSYSAHDYYSPSYSCSVAWTAASYDANGFPIYGYSYGRPVYGYTASGSPIFSFSLLYAGCYVPNWGPASWCHSHHHYPHGVHRAPKPPKHDHAHKPGVRPPAHAPIHKKPESVMGKPKPRPAHHTAKPQPRPSAAARPSTHTRPFTATRPSTSTRPSTTSRPSTDNKR